MLEGYNPATEQGLKCGTILSTCLSIEVTQLTFFSALVQKKKKNLRLMECQRNTWPMTFAVVHYYESRPPGIRKTC